MSRKPQIIALGAVVALVALVAACSEPTSNAPTQLNLDRPVDIGFACHGSLKLKGDGTIIQSAQPTISCEDRSRDPDTLPLDPTDPDKMRKIPLEPPNQVGAGDTSWYGFILQSAPGTVAVAQWSTQPTKSFSPGSVLVLDADKLTPGKNSISVGEEPIAIATDPTGCYEVIANAGSCDLSTLDVNSAVANSILNGHPDGPVKVARKAVTNAAGMPILARPAAMIGQPSLKEADLGATCGPEPTGLAYIAYPGCHLVAAVDMASGKMVASIKYTGTVAQVSDGNQMCPSECVVDKGNPVVPGPRPVALAFDAGSSRLAIGADNLASIAVVDLDPTTFLPLPTVLQIPLENRTGDLGISALALSSVIPMGGDRNGVLGDDTMSPRGGLGQYVYAVASDSTVRVADVRNVRRECDTQLDSRFVRAIRDVPTLQCLPIGDPTLPRRSGVKGPGIELIGDGAPLSVAFFTVPRIAVAGNTGRPQATETDPVTKLMKMVNLDDPRTTLIGHFAVITATSGASYVVNVDDDDAFGQIGDVEADVFSPDDPLATTPTLVIPHQLRDNGRYRGAVESPATGTDGRGQYAPTCTDLGPAGDLAVGGPHATTGPARNLVAGSPVAANKADELPGLRNVTCDEPMPKRDTSKPDHLVVSELLFSAPLAIRDEVFPDLRSVRLEEQWSLMYEGGLSLDVGNTSIDGPQVRNGQTRVDSTGLHLVDPSRPFCEIGVEPFDIVQLRGCDPTHGNLDCPTGYECFIHPESQLAMGACMLSNEAERLANLCRDFLISGRRYTAAPNPASGDVVLLPRKHVLRTTPIDGCVDDNQCTLLANYAAHARTDKDPVGSPVVQPMGQLKDVNGHQWSCQADSARSAVNPDPARNKRCVQVCTTNADCNVEDDELNRRFNLAQFRMVCQSGVCMEGVAPPQQCMNGPQRYDVHASEAFAVIGSRTGYLHPFIADAGGKCIKDPNASTQAVGRIPLKAPPCDSAADPITGKLPGGGFEPNPCSLTADTSETAREVAVGSDACTVTTRPDLVPLVRPAPAIRFRNRSMKLTLVDPYYPGDSQCILDRAGPYGKMPLVFPGFQLAFHQINGFAPLTLPNINPSFPIKVVRGPTDSIWILDDGDFLSTSPIQPSTRGKVFRIESVNNLNTISLLQ